MLSYADWDPGLDELWGGGWDERGAVSRTIITCFKDGFSFLRQDMKMGPEAQSLNGNGSPLQDLLWLQTCGLTGYGDEQDSRDSNRPHSYELGAVLQITKAFTSPRHQH